VSEAAVSDQATSEQPSSSPSPGAALLHRQDATPAPSGETNGAGDAAKTVDMEQDANGDWRIAARQGLDEDTAGAWDNVAKRYNTPADLAKAHVSLVKTMDKRIPIPENDNEDAWNEVYSKLGRPESPDKYELTVPKSAPWDETEVQRIKETELPLLHKYGATQRQVNGYLEQKAELDRLAVDAWEARSNDLSEADDRALRQQWIGKAWDENHNLAKANAERMWNDQELEQVSQLRTVDGRYVLDLPIIKAALAKNERNFLEDDRDPTGFNSSRIADIDSQIQKVRDEAAEKGLTPSSPGYPHEAIEALMAKKPGSKKNLFTSVG